MTVLALSGCARDVNKGENQQEPFPLEIRLGMNVQEDAQQAGIDSWYYMVFNFSDARGATEDDYPVDIIANEDRGQNWELYIVFHRDNETGETLVRTARRPRLPTILRTDAGPVDAAVGLFNDDEVNDIVAAARDGNTIQLTPGVENTIFDNTFFEEEPVTIDTGTAPVRIFSAGPSAGAGEETTAPLDFNGDDNQDLLVIYAGGAPGSAVIRPLLGDGEGDFTAGTETSVPGIPVDAALADFGGGSDFDLAILTTDTEGGEGTVRLFIGGADGVFTAGDTAAVGGDPQSIAAGDLDGEEGLDIAVTNLDDNTISTLNNDGSGGFSAGPVLDTPGPPVGVAINTMLAPGGDVVFSYNTTGTEEGNVGAYINQGTGFAAAPITGGVMRPAGRLISFDAGDDTTPDVIMADGSTTGSGGNVVIVRGNSVRPDGATTNEFEWIDTVEAGGGPILYPAASQPFRVIAQDINGDDELDLIVPNAGSGTNGNQLNLYYALGRYNYTDENIYWTDGIRSSDRPEDLTLQPWYISHQFTGTTMEVTIDALQFSDLTQLLPEDLLSPYSDRTFFMFDLMTATHPIDLENKPFELRSEGIVNEHFTQPVTVPLEIGYIDNEQSAPRISPDITPRPHNITNWFVEVN